MYPGCFDVGPRGHNDDFTGLGLNRKQEWILDFYHEQLSGWSGLFITMGHSKREQILMQKTSILVLFGWFRIHIKHPNGDIKEAAGCTSLESCGQG